MSAENGFDALQTKPSHSNADADSLEANVNVPDGNEMSVNISVFEPRNLWIRGKTKK